MGDGDGAIIPVLVVSVEAIIALVICIVITGVWTEYCSRIGFSNISFPVAVPVAIFTTSFILLYYCDECECY